MYVLEDVCWAIVVSELIRVIRILDGRDEDHPNTLYSPQDLIDFTRPNKRSTLNKPPDHYCYSLNRNAAMQYVVDNGLQKEEDRPFIGCSEDQPNPWHNRDPSRCVYIKDYVTIPSSGGGRKLIYRGQNVRK